MQRGGRDCPSLPLSLPPPPRPVPYLLGAAGLVEAMLGGEVVPQEQGALVVAGALAELVVAPRQGRAGHDHLGGRSSGDGRGAPGARHEAGLLAVVEPRELLEPGALEGDVQLLQQGLGPGEREVPDALPLAAALRLVPAVAPRPPAAAAAAALGAAAVAQAAPFAVLLVVAAVTQRTPVLDQLLALQQPLGLQSLRALQLHLLVRPPPIEVLPRPGRGLAAIVGGGVGGQKPPAAAEGQSPAVPLGEHGAGGGGGRRRVLGQQQLLLLGSSGLQLLGLQPLQLRLLVRPAPVQRLGVLPLPGLGPRRRGGRRGGNEAAAAERERPPVYLREHGGRAPRPPPGRALRPPRERGGGRRRPAAVRGRRPREAKSGRSLPAPPGPAWIAAGAGLPTMDPARSLGGGASVPTGPGSGRVANEQRAAHNAPRPPPAAAAGEGRGGGARAGGGQEGGGAGGGRARAAAAPRHAPPAPPLPAPPNVGRRGVGVGGYGVDPLRSSFPSPPTSARAGGR